jgi:hypothetical protein
MSHLRHLAIAMATAALLGGLASPVLAEEAVTVDATVTMAAPCLTVSTPSLDFGVTHFSTDANPGVGDQPITYTSCSAASERVFVRGTDAAEVGGGTTAWTLSATTNGCDQDLGPNVFKLVAYRLSGPIWNLGKFDQQVETLDPGADGSLDRIQFTAPCVGSDGSGATLSFSITATF